MDEELTVATSALLDYLQNPTVAIVAHLAQNTIDPEVEQPVLGSLTECNFAGYAPIADLKFDAVDDDDGIAGHVMSADLEFAAGDGVATQLCTAFYVTRQHGDNPPELLHLEIFSAPFSFEFSGQTFKRRVRIMVGTET